jgi:hypothetical protein
MFKRDRSAHYLNERFDLFKKQRLLVSGGAGTGVLDRQAHREDAWACVASMRISVWAETYLQTLESRLLSTCRRTLGIGPHSDLLAHFQAQRIGGETSRSKQSYYLGRAVDRR